MMKGHPLLYYILNVAPWTRLWLTRFSSALDALQGASNFQGLLRRIKNPDTFSEGESVLDVAFQFFAAGFQISFEPSVSVTRQDGRITQKRPDLKIINLEAAEEIIVEVSMLTSSASHRRASENSNFVLPFISRVLIPAGLTMYAEMSAHFDESCVEKTVEDLTLLAKDAERNGELRTLVNAWIEAGIAPDSREEELKRWASGRGISPDIAGPPIESNELQRTIGKVRDKLAQLPENQPGLIVIPVTRTRLFFHYDINLVVEVLRAEISRYPRLLCVVLSHNYMGVERGGPPVTNSENQALINKTTGRALHEETLILLNKACHFPVTGNTREKLQNAFRVA